MEWISTMCWKQCKHGLNIFWEIKAIRIYLFMHSIKSEVQVILQSKHTIFFILLFFCCVHFYCSWSIHVIYQPIFMMTSSNGNIFRVTGHLCGEFTDPRWIPRTKASERSFEVFFDLLQIKWLNKQSQGWWYETLSRPLWRHNDVARLGTP